MNYIEEALSKFNYEVNGSLSKEAEKNVAIIEKRIENINALIDDLNQKIQLWQNDKLVSDKNGKAALNELIKAEKEILIANKHMLADEKSKRDAYMESARTYVEASKIINDSYKARASLHGENMDISEVSYKIWLQNNEDTASKGELFEKELSHLNEKLEIQSNIVNDTKTAYAEMIELYGEASLESKTMQSTLLDEVYAYNKIAESIRNIATLKDDTKAAQERESIFVMNDYLKKYKNSLSEGGFSEEEIYNIAKNVSGFSANKITDLTTLPVNLTIEDNEITEISSKISSALTADINARDSYKNTGEDFARALGEGFTKQFKSITSDILKAAEYTAKEATTVMKNAVTNNTTNYNFASAKQTIFQQIEDAKNADEMNKARGIK